MKKVGIFICALSLACVACLVAGCGSGGDSAGGGTNFQSAFKKTDSHVREFAEQAVEAEKKGEFSTAFRHYRALSLNPDLTDQQRNLANEEMLEMTKKLREAAEKGDTQAAQTIEEYRATK